MPSHARHSDFHHHPFPNRRGDARLSFWGALLAVKREAEEDWGR